MSDIPSQDSARDDRMKAIEAAAYELLAQKGPRATSMLEVAKRAKASNQTMYKWYGDKHGLFLSMVRRNAMQGATVLSNALAGQHDLWDIIDQLGPALLRLVLSDRAVALNRAAASDAHAGNELGSAIFGEGRAKIQSMLTELLARSHTGDVAELGAGLYLDTLISDTQIRRVIGVTDAPPDRWIDEQSARAKKILQRWLQDAPVS